MIHPQNKVCTDRIIDIRNNLFNGLPYDLIDIDAIEDFIDTFILTGGITNESTQKRGCYNALLIGYNDSDIVRKMLGVTMPWIHNSSIEYPITVQRTYKDNLLRLYFTDNYEILSKHEMLLETMFRTYSPEDKLSKYFKDKQFKFPSLNIVFDDKTFLDILDDETKLLMSNNLVEKLHISIAVPSDTQIESLIHTLDIIPSPTLDINDSSSCNNMRNDIQCLNVFQHSGNEKTYNFVFLDSANDYLIRLFFALLDKYNCRYHLTDLRSQNLLSHVFFYLNDSFLSSSRFSEENSDFRELIHTPANYITIQQRHSEVYLGNVAMCLNGMITSYCIPPYEPWHEGGLEAPQAAYNTSSTNMRDILSGLHTAIMTIEGICKDLEANNGLDQTNTRQNYINKLDRAIGSLHDIFSEYSHYCKQKLDAVADELEKEKDLIYETKNSFFTSNTYIINTQQCWNIMVNIRQKIYDVIAEFGDNIHSTTLEKQYVSKDDINNERYKHEKQIQNFYAMSSFLRNAFYIFNTPSSEHFESTDTDLQSV